MVSIVRIEFNSLLSLLTQLLLNRLQHVMVNGCWCNLITVVSSLPQGSASGSLLFNLLHTRDLIIFEHKL